MNRSKDDEQTKKWEDKKMKERTKEDKKERKRWVKINDEWQVKTTPKRMKEDDSTGSNKKNLNQIFLSWLCTVMVKK